MFLKQDWILRQIQMIVDMVARIVFHKGAISYEIENAANPSQTDLLYSELIRLIDQRKLGEAEDRLMEQIDVNDRKHLELALDFYQKLNRLSDNELEQSGFPRSEISDGLNTILKLFELGNLAN